MEGKEERDGDDDGNEVVLFPLVPNFGRFPKIGGATWTNKLESHQQAGTELHPVLAHRSGLVASPATTNSISIIHLPCVIETCHGACPQKSRQRPRWQEPGDG